MHRSLPTQRLDSVINTDRGLSQDEVAARLKQYGSNDIVEASTAAWVTLLQDTMRDPMLWFLLGTAALFLFLGDKVEAATLLVAIAPLVGMDWYLHRRTQASTEGLKSRLATQARVLRANGELLIPAAELVPGDLVILSAGENIPADGIVISAESTQMDESSLTGESYPVRKQAMIQLKATSSEVSVDTVHWAFAGTRLLTGKATIRIVYTGAETRYGEIVHSASSSRRDRTPLQNAIANLVGVLLVAAVILCLFLAWVRWRQGFGLVDALLSAVTLAVAALPEEFPVVFTFFLGVGVYRLAQRRALVRRAVVVENIGRVSCICSDKTGTMTEGVLLLAHRLPVDGLSENELLEVAAMASRKETGDPLDLAILRLAPDTQTPSSALTTFPFTEDRKRESAIWRQDDSTLMVVTKGAPETVFDLCILTQQARESWESRVADLAATGHKVIACAQRLINASSWAGGEPDRGFHFAGILAFEDPVREGVLDAVQQCRNSGIHVLMVTGDHPLTAKAVARDIGLGEGEPHVVDATHIQSLLQQDPAALKTVDVIARAVPAQKLRIVKSLQSVGEVVAVTGDGVNDVPALQAADIGIAMGERGTRSAREAAAIMLLDDNFHTITRAIAEGRQLFRNLRLSFAYLLMVHIPLVVTAALIPLAGYPLLYLPIHIVWLELIIHPTALLVFQELPANKRLEPRQQNHRLRLFNRREWFVMTAVGGLMSLMIIFGYEYSLGIGYDVEHARAVAMIMLALTSVMVTVVLSRLATKMSKVIVLGTIISTILFVQIEPLATLLHLAPLHLDDLMLCLAGTLGLAVFTAMGRFGKQ